MCVSNPQAAAAPRYSTLFGIRLLFPSTDQRWVHSASRTPCPAPLLGHWVVRERGPSHRCVPPGACCPAVMRPGAGKTPATLLQSAAAPRTLPRYRPQSSCEMSSSAHSRSSFLNCYPDTSHLTTTPDQCVSSHLGISRPYNQQPLCHSPG